MSQNTDTHFHLLLCALHTQSHSSSVVISMSSLTPFYRQGNWGSEWSALPPKYTASKGLGLAILPLCTSPTSLWLLKQVCSFREKRPSSTRVKCSRWSQMGVGTNSDPPRTSCGLQQSPYLESLSFMSTRPAVQTREDYLRNREKLCAQKVLNKG